MAEIVLATINAKWAHASFGLRYLLANLGSLRERACIVEFDLQQRPVDMLEAMLKHEPRIVGLGIYIWNAELSTQLAALLKQVKPEVTLVLGGPEISYETQQQEIARYADYIITGEADVAFRQLCEKLLQGSGGEARHPDSVRDQATQRPATRDPAGRIDDGRDAYSIRAEARREPRPPIALGRWDEHSSMSLMDQKVIAAELPEMDQVVLPYGEYTDRDVAHRVVYVEASRGCPFKCEFCLSSLDVPVRQVPVEAFLQQMQTLLDRGLMQFKFVDRTFNLNLQVSAAILRFFLQRMKPGLFLHFEMIPDRLPQGLRELIRQFPAGALQFEVGIQTFNEQVADLISRKQNNLKVEENLRWLRRETHVHVHADLIFGLPGETVESFARGFDRLVALQPHEIQVGMLKRLRGTPIVRHDQAWAMVYSPHPPYEILSNRLIDFAMMQRLRRFARFWDLVANSGRFAVTLPLLLGELQPAEAEAKTPAGNGEAMGEEQARGTSAFARFLGLSDWLYAHESRAHGIALPRLTELLHRYLIEELGLAAERVNQAIMSDRVRNGQTDKPSFMNDVNARLPRRQARHQSAK